MAVTPTYVPLATVTLSSAASSVTFSSIPATYRDLIILGVARSSRTADAFDLLTYRLNTDAGTNYSYVSMTGNAPSGASESVGSSSSAAVCRLNTSSGSNTVANAFTLQIMDYSATDKHKTALGRGAATQEAQGVSAHASRWANTAAVNSVRLVSIQGNDLAAGTTISIYGVN